MCGMRRQESAWRQGKTIKEIREIEKVERKAAQPLIGGTED